MTRRTLPLLLAASIILTGCGLRDPYSQPWQKGTVGVSGAPALTRPSQQQLLPQANSTTSVIVHYTTLWVNWTAATLPRERAGLLALATGQLGDELRQEAAQAVKTRLQEVSQAYSRGGYVGVIGQHGGRVIVVTYEEVALVGGQAQGAYHVYLARTERTAQGWRLSEWQPATDS